MLDQVRAAAVVAVVLTSHRNDGNSKVAQVLWHRRHCGIPTNNHLAHPEHGGVTSFCGLRVVHSHSLNFRRAVSLGSRQGQLFVSADMHECSAVCVLTGCHVLLPQAYCFTIHAKDLLQACPALSETRIKDLVIDAREVSRNPKCPFVEDDNSASTASTAVVCGVWHYAVVRRCTNWPSCSQPDMW